MLYVVENALKTNPLFIQIIWRKFALGYEF